MKHTKTISENVSREIVDKITCDMCGCDGNSTGNWKKERWSHEFEETIISFSEGRRYPDCGDHVEITCDICPDCFKNMLIPWLKSQGVEPQTTKYDW